VENNNNFVKSLNLWDAVAIVAGAMIGSGIFIVASDVARQVDSVWLILLVWVVAGIMTLCGALSYGEYAASWPEAGGQYVYIKNVWGKLTGFLYGWTVFTVMQTGGIAAVCVAFAKFAAILCPLISSNIKLFSFHGFSISTLQAVAIALLITITYINSKGVKAGVTVQNIFTAAKIVSLLAIIIFGLCFGLNPQIIAENMAHTPSHPDHINVLSLVAIALVGALFSSDAWNNVTFIAGEIKDASKNLPRALLIGTGIVTILYLLTNLTYLSALSIESIKTAPEDLVAASLIGTVMGSGGKIVIALIVMVSAIGCANGMILAGARLFYAMAKDGLFFSKLAKLNEDTHVPTNSLMLQCFWASILVLSGSYSELLDYVIFAALLFYILTVGGLFVFRRKYPDIPRPYKTILYPYLPIIYCVLAAFTAVNLLIYKPAYTWPGLMLVAAGIPVYFIWQAVHNARIAREAQEQEALQ